ncbi:thiamine phosphate synthase [Pandoraea bronchicola]|uniref:ThiE n=1 Tax=Pandoraea bronchicola TaxID=2508287 RepID=A0A5E5BX12_9BURK|nr:thiamine phosphate synthase [Pandoraea bronchicola]VVE89917.1 ThiE [Pandoraea bronchicola]
MTTHTGAATLSHVQCLPADAPLATAWQQAAAGIRARLAPWPEDSTSPHWRLHAQTPASAGKGDVVWWPLAPQGALGTAASAQIELWRAAGAVVLCSHALAHGHVEDALYTRDAVYRIAGVDDPAFFPAFAAFLDCGFVPQDALVLARAWRTDGSHARSEDADTLGAWPTVLETFPAVLGQVPSPGGFPACPSHLGLYPVLPDAGWCERMADLQVGTVQLRIKDPAHPALRSEIARTVAAGRRVTRDSAWFINDHWREAAQANAYGVHLGQEDMAALSADEVATLFASGMRLGISTHGYYEILAAHHFRPSYLAVGAVFPTTTKVIATAPQGLAKLARYVKLVAPHYPLVAIGGIDADNLSRVLDTGVRCAAVVRAVTQAADVAAAVEGMQREFARRG